MIKRKRCMDYSNKQQQETIMLKSQAFCQDLKPEESGMLGKPKKE